MTGIGSETTAFVVEDPTGTKLLFGKTPESRSFGKDWTAFKIANISEIHYPHGKNVKYRYRKPSYSDTYCDFYGRLPVRPPSLLDEIEYRADNQLLGRVKFTYEDRQRPVGENTLRLKMIGVFDENNYLSHSYDLFYDTQDLLATVEWRDPKGKLLQSWTIIWEIRNSEPLLGIFDSGNSVSTEFRYQMAKRLRDMPLQVIKADVNEIYTSWIAAFEYPRNRGWIEFELSSKLETELLHLKGQFTQYYLANIIKLKGEHTVRIYELILQYANTHLQNCVIDLDSLRAMLVLQDGYKLSANF
jgi:hypothetical protein